MKKGTSFGIVIKVKNLELCKAFYRNILDLGQPILDSLFWVEFHLGEQSALYLVKAEWEQSLPKDSGRISWFFEDGDAEQIAARMTACGYASCILPDSEKAGFLLAHFCDPEGNSFYVPAKNRKK